ncbi:MAG: peptidoglycan editing factor PgeF [Patescibacteria group bacterium]|nr:peptidoglycan editing factor PgeF [Patescibacteria group bacterium]
MFFNSNLKIFTSFLINNNYFLAGFGTKELGDGRKSENLISFFKKNNINFSKIIVPKQIHSTNVYFYQQATNPFLVEKIEDIDGLITKEKDVVLTVITADCVPIIFIEEKEKIIGISHQGWRGSIKRMSQKMIDKVIEAGGKIENLKILIGPSIGDCCYDVKEERYYQFKEEFDSYSEKIFRFFKGGWHLSLAKLNYLLLIDKGVKKENIDFFPFCTNCDKKRFFSYRRYKRKKNEEYGEMVSFVLRKF